MTDIEILQSPNPKAISLKFPSSSDLDGYSKIVMTHSYSSQEINSSAIGRYSWLAENFCEAVRDMAHVDLVRHDDFDVLTLVRRLPWRSEAAQKAAENLQDYLDEGNPIINRDEIEKYLHVQNKFNPGKDPYLLTVSKVFNKAVHEKLAQDGGSIEITDIVMNQNNGQINIGTLMLGSCSQCGGEGQTLDLARSMLEYTFNGLREQNPTNELLKKTHIGAFKPQEAQRGFIMRA